MSVKDPVFESAQETYVIHALVAKMRGVVIKAEPSMLFYCLQRAVRRGDVESDFSRVDLEREVHIERIESFQYREEAFSKIVEPLLNEILTCWGNSVAVMPEAAAR